MESVNFENGKLIEKRNDNSYFDCVNESELKLNLDENDDLNKCGIFNFQPKCLQPFANNKSFLVVFCLTSIIQGMFYTYFVSVLTTIEKLFQVQSKTTGLIMSATEIGQIGAALLLTYYGGQGNRPKWIACGMIVFAIASFLGSLPHYLFNKTNSTNLTYSNQFNFISMSSPWKIENNLCFNQNSSRSLTSSSNLTYHDQNDAINSSLSLFSSKCSLSEQTNYQTYQTKLVLSIFFVSLFLIGIGSTTVNNLGIPYMDDNVASKESPLYFGITIGVRIFGPVLGFVLGSICTNIHVDFPFEHFSVITSSDPRWIGAWWLGFLIVGSLISFTSIIMATFPKRLPKLDTKSYSAIKQQSFFKDDQQLSIINGQSQILTQTNQKFEEEKMVENKPNLKDFPVALKRLLKNDILILRTLSSVLHILPIAGVYTFLPKYLESQFQLTASKANMTAGTAGIMVMCIGIFSSGIVMRKFKPNAKLIAFWIALSALLYSIGMVILTMLGCPLENIIGMDIKSVTNLTQNWCSNECLCSSNDFSPICTSEKTTYLSPCQAGCSQITANGSFYLYSNCKCLKPNVTANSGFCWSECSNLIWYTLVFSFFVLIHSTSEVGSMLLTLRCVDPKDKALALGLMSFAIGLFSNVPCPIIYGAVIDSACLYWEENCDQKGACRIYDPAKFRIFFHGITAAIMFAGFIVDSIVWYKAPSINLIDEEKNSKIGGLEIKNTEKESSL